MMKRVRLQVALLPWGQPGSQSSSSGQSRQEPLKPWLQVCTEDISLQELADQIVQKFSRIYVGLGQLTIRHLESDYGEILDLADTVGDVFDDRAPSGESRTSIVRVACLPPDARGLSNAIRFGSLMPESSARPRKRPLESSPRHSRHDSLTAIPSIERWSSKGSSLTVGRESKRHKRNPSGRSECVSDSEQDDSQETVGKGFVQVVGSQEDPMWESQSSYADAASCLSTPSMYKRNGNRNPIKTIHKPPTSVVTGLNLMHQDSAQLGHGSQLSRASPNEFTLDNEIRTQDDSSHARDITEGRLSSTSYRPAVLQCPSSERSRSLQNNGNGKMQGFSTDQRRDSSPGLQRRHKSVPGPIEAGIQSHSPPSQIDQISIEPRSSPSTTTIGQEQGTDLTQESYLEEQLESEIIHERTSKLPELRSQVEEEATIFETGEHTQNIRLSIERTESSTIEVIAIQEKTGNEIFEDSVANNEEATPMNEEPDKGQNVQSDETIQEKLTELEANARARKVKELEGQRAADEFLAKKRTEGKKTFTWEPPRGLTGSLSPRLSRSGESSSRNTREAPAAGSVTTDLGAAGGSPDLERQPAVEPLALKSTVMTALESSDRNESVATNRYDEAANSPSALSTEAENTQSQNLNEGRNIQRTATSEPPTAFYPGPSRTSEPFWQSKHIGLNDAPDRALDAASSTDKFLPRNSISRENSIEKGFLPQRSRTPSLSSTSALLSEEYDLDSASDSDSSSMASSPTPTLSQKPVTPYSTESLNLATQEDIKASSSVKNEAGTDSLLQHQLLMTPPSTSNADRQESADGQCHPNKPRRSHSPSRTHETAAKVWDTGHGGLISDAHNISTVARSEIDETTSDESWYPRFSDMHESAKISPSQQTLSRSSERNALGTSRQRKNDQYSLSSDSDESSESGQEGLGATLTGLRKLTTLRKGEPSRIRNL